MKAEVFEELDEARKNEEEIRKLYDELEVIHNRLKTLGESVPAETLVIPNLGGNKYQILKRLNKEMEFICEPVYYTDLTECEKHITKMPIEFEVMIYVERAQITV